MVLNIAFRGADIVVPLASQWEFAARWYFPHFPTLMKEQNAALALIVVSGLSILVINGAYRQNPLQ